jgi:hypothetical protein
MDENLVEDFLSKIAKLEKELENKNQIIKELENKVNQNEEAKENPLLAVVPGKSKWSLLSKASRFKSYMANSIKFGHSSQGDHSKIEFPASLSVRSPEVSSLSRGLSTNSFIAQVLGEIRAIDTKKSEIQEEIDQKRKGILEKAQKSIETMESYYTSSLSSLNDKLLSLASSIKSEIETSLILENDTKRIFIIESINTSDLQVNLIQLKDKYGIALKDPKTVTKSIKDLENYRAIIKSETDGIMNSLEKNKITVYYQVIQIENNEKICCPINIIPDSVVLQDYEIKFNNNQQEITEILNKSEGPVKFSTVLVSEDCGLMQASIIEIYTYEINAHIINILHLHIEDMKDEIPVEAVYILDTQTPQEYEDWSKDAFGRELRYKIVVKTGRIEAVLYNTGSTTEYINFIERRISKGDLFKYKDSVLELVGVPTGLLTRDWQGKESEFPSEYSLKQPVSYCHARHAVDLPGLVDVKVVLDGGELSAAKKEFAVPICECIDLSPTELQDVQETFKALEDSKASNTLSSVHKIESLVNEYNSMQVQDKKAFLSQLGDLVLSVKEAFSAKPDAWAQYQVTILQAERVMRSVAVDIRFNS